MEFSMWFGRLNRHLRVEHEIKARANLLKSVVKKKDIDTELSIRFIYDSILILLFSLCSIFIWYLFISNSDVPFELMINIICCVCTHFLSTMSHDRYSYLLLSPFSHLCISNNIRFFFFSCAIQLSQCITVPHKLCVQNHTKMSHVQRWRGASQHEWANEWMKKMKEEWSTWSKTNIIWHLYGQFAECMPWNIRPNSRYDTKY